MFGTVLGRVWGSACVLISRQFGAGLGELVCAVCGKICGRFGGVGFLLCLGQFAAGLG